MYNKLIWGTNVLEMLRALGVDGNIVAVIRHSERPDFNSLPCHEWENVGLTALGTIMATKFGHELSEFQNAKSFQIFGWGLKRCMETAEAISKGARNGSSQVDGPSSIALKSPIANREAYDKALFSCKWDLWEQMINDWLIDKTPQTIMTPARQYAKDIYLKLLAKKFCSPEKITIIVTHDLHILPLARLFFPTSSRWLDYLNGVVLKAKGDQINVGFDESFAVVKPEDLIIK